MTAAVACPPTPSFEEFEAQPPQLAQAAAVASPPNPSFEEFEAQPPQLAQGRNARTLRLGRVSLSTAQPFYEGETADTPEGTTNFVLRGPSSGGGGPLVVCVHGLNASVASFEAVAPLLVEKGMRVLAYDLYGFGLSSVRPAGRRLDLGTFIGQLEGLLAVAGVAADEQIYLLGFSLGGLVVAEFAKRFPERVGRVLLAAPAIMQRSYTPCKCCVFGCLRSWLGICCFYLLRLLTCCCLCKFVQRMILRSSVFSLMMTPDVESPENFVDVRDRNVDRCGYDMKRAILSYVQVVQSMPLWEDASRETFEGLSRSPVEVLFVWGTDDATVPWHGAEESVIRCFSTGGTPCIFVEGAGHGILIENAETVANYAAAWFCMYDHHDAGWARFFEECRLSCLMPALEGAML